MTALAAVALLFAGAFVKGILGLGLPMIAIPGLTLLVGLPQALAICVLPVALANAWQVWQFRKTRVDLHMLAGFVTAGAVGGAIGSGSGDDADPVSWAAPPAKPSPAATSHGAADRTGRWHRGRASARCHRDCRPHRHHLLPFHALAAARVHLCHRGHVPLLRHRAAAAAAGHRHPWQSGTGYRSSGFACGGGGLNSWSCRGTTH